MSELFELLHKALDRRTSGRRFICWFVAFKLFGINPCLAEDPELAATPYELARLVAHLDCRAIRESSGLASSRKHEHLLWTHNDSGGQPAIYAFNQEGQHLGKVRIEGAKAIDWEDMASFELDGEPWLLVADTGDNQQNREACQLYLLREPDHLSEVTGVDHVINFTYEGGCFDCEAVAVDSASRQILLASKDWSFTCKLFALPFPDQLTRLDGESPPGKSSDGSILVARHIADLKLPGVTGLDISPDGCRAIALTYAHAYEYQRREGEAWMSAFSRQGREVQLPPRRQSEAICFRADGKAIYCTSEACPAPLFCAEVALASEDPRDELP